MKKIKKYISGSLKFKILSVSALFLTGMLASILIGGYFLVHQNRVIQQAVFDVSDRAKKATNARFSLLEIDRSIQQLIAADEPADIRKATIASIKGGAILEENLSKLKQSMPDSENVAEMVHLIKVLRPVQLDVIRLGRKNLDSEATQKSQNIVASLKKIDNLSNTILDEAQAEATGIAEASASEADHILNMIALFGGIGVFLGAIIAMLAARMISTPLVKLEAIMANMAKGDLTDDINFSLAGKDELGRILVAISETLDNQRGLLSDISSATQQVSMESSCILNNAQDIGNANERLNLGVDEISKNTKTVHDATSVATVKLEDAASKTLMVASHAENTSKKTFEIADNFSKFQSKMEIAANSSRDLSDMAQEIQAITKTINTISNQTNLLALNAAIEAARAGEQGRGFAVVAEEVRTLASHTGAAVENISKLIETVSNKVESSVTLIDESLKDATMNISELQLLAQESHENSDEITKISGSMAELVELVSVQEVANKQITETVGQLGSLATSNTSHTEALHKLSSNLDQAANGLFCVVSQFRLTA